MIKKDAFFSSTTIDNISRSKVVTLLTLALPGLRLIQDGQMEGFTRNLPVELGRRYPEPLDKDLELYYRRLIPALQHPVFHEGQWTLLESHAAWKDNPSHHNIIGFRWQMEDVHRLVVVNLADYSSQCYMPIRSSELGESSWIFNDIMSDIEYQRDGGDFLPQGLYLDMPGYGYHLFEIVESG
jgi:hypothetical protein